MYQPSVPTSYNPYTGCSTISEVALGHFATAGVPAAVTSLAVNRLCLLYGPQTANACLCASDSEAEFCVTGLLLVMNDDDDDELLCIIMRWRLMMCSACVSAPPHKTPHVDVSFDLYIDPLRVTYKCRALRCRG